MAAYGWIEFDVRCPTCGASVDDVVWLPWGGVLSYDMGRGPVYRLGWRLLWHLGDDGVAEPNTTWTSGHATNLGDPRIQAVDVVADNAPTRCPHCGNGIGGIKVAIRDGMIAGVTVLARMDVAPHVVAVVIDRATGEPVEELSDSVVRVQP